MITIRKRHDKEWEQLTKFLEMETLSEVYLNFNKDNIHIIVFDGQSILGFAQISEEHKEIAIINSIYISKNHRNEGLGDALFRATLHFITSREYKHILIERNEALERFLLSRQSGLSDDLKELGRNKCIGSNKVYICNPNILLKSRCKG